MHINEVANRVRKVDTLVRTLEAAGLAPSDDGAAEILASWDDAHWAMLAQVANVTLPSRETRQLVVIHFEQNRRAA